MTEESRKANVELAGAVARLVTTAVATAAAFKQTAEAARHAAESLRDSRGVRQ